LEWTIKSEEELPKVINEMLAVAGNRKKWMFSGDLGAGKTTMIKKIGQILGCQDGMSSPTFSLVNEYETQDGVVYHLDLYRLKDLEEALNIGIEEYLDQDTYCFIEWPELIRPIWPLDAVEINIQIIDDSIRKIIFV